MKKYCFLLSFVLGLPVSAEEIVVPNFNFDLIYKVDTEGEVTGIVSDGGWTQGVGPECPIDSGTYNFSDGTVDTIADIPGWVGYDRDTWVELGGTYERDQTTGNLQGSIGNQGQGVDGSMYYLANGGQWGNPAGGLIVSDAPLGNVEEDATYTLTMVAKGSASPVVLDLLAGGIVLTPTASVDPALTGAYQEFSRTYDPDILDDFVGEPLTIVLGVGRNAINTQSHFDNVTLNVTELRCPGNLSAAGGPDGVTLAWENRTEMPTSVRILRDAQEVESAAPADPPTYTDADAEPGLIGYELIFTMPGEDCKPLTTTFDACITDLAGTPSEAGVVLTWTNNLAYDGIEIKRNGEVLEAALDGTAETYTDEAPPMAVLTYTVVPTNGTCDPTTVDVNLSPVSNPGFEDPELADGSYIIGGPDWTTGYYDLAVDPLLWNTGWDDAGIWNPDDVDGFTDGAAFAGENTGWAVSASGTDAGLSQVLEIVLEEDTEYTLSVQIGNALYNASDETAPYRIELLAGGVLLVSEDAESPLADTWKQHTLIYNSADNPGQVGEQLEIRLIAVAYVDGNAEDGYEVDFDQVNFTFQEASGGVGPFIRGDCNDDGSVNISDAQYLLNFLFLGGSDLVCNAAGDANNDEQVNISDAQYTLNFLFLGGPDIGEPFPDCGSIPEGGPLECAESSCE